MCWFRHHNEHDDGQDCCYRLCGCDDERLDHSFGRDGHGRDCGCDHARDDANDHVDDARNRPVRHGNGDDGYDDHDDHDDRCDYYKRNTCLYILDIVIMNRIGYTLISIKLDSF